MITYEAIYNPEESTGVYGISLVEDPAMQGTFIALSKERIKLSVVDPEKRILAGLVLEPNKNIYRNQDGKEFNMFFKTETVKDLCYSFTKNKFNKNSTIEHADKIEGVAFVENWLVRDSKIDTAVALGLDCKKGSWVSVMEIKSDEVWNDYIKTGKVKGFSIDAMIALKEVNLKTEVKMNKEELKSFSEDLLTQFKAVFSTKEKIDVKLGTAVLKDGETKIEYTGETPEEGADVWVVNGEEKAPLPVGEYPLEDGTVLVVVEDGKIDSVKPIEEAPAESPAELDSDTMSTEKIEQLIKSLTIKYAAETKEQIEAVTKSFETKFSEQKLEIEGLNKRLGEPAAVALSSAPTQAKPREKWTNREIMEYNKENKY